MDNQRKDHSDPERPSQRNCSKQLQTHNLPTHDVENTNSTNYGGDLLFVNKPRTVSRLTERMPQGKQRNRRAINQNILKERKTRWKNVAMAWIDNKKAYDMVLQSWIIDCLKMYKISGEVKMFFETTTENWWVELTAGGKSLAEEKIQRGIFQGDALSPLLFVIAMIPLNPILRKCSGGYKLHINRKKRSIT